MAMTRAAASEVLVEHAEAQLVPMRTIRHLLDAYDRRHRAFVMQLYHIEQAAIRARRLGNRVRQRFTMAIYYVMLERIPWRMGYYDYERSLRARLNEADARRQLLAARLITLPQND